MTPILIFIAGSALLIYSAEKLIGYLVRVASSLNISIFLLAIVFTGIEFDDIFLGVALNVEELDRVALGIVFGTALSMTGVVLALAAILTPTDVKIPRNYLTIFAIAPLMMIVFTLMAPLTAVDGLILLGLSILFITYVVVRECSADTPVFRDAEMYEAYAAVRGSGHDTHAFRDMGMYTRNDERGSGRRRPGKESHLPSAERMPFAKVHGRSGWTGLGLAVLALTGVIIGAAAAGFGTEGILQNYELEGTIFGATIATAVLTVEDIFLTVEPVRRGVPEIGVGNVIGSVAFSVSGKLGIILLAGGLVIGPNVLTWHLPALIVVTGLAAYFVSTGRLRRWHGYTLLVLYIVYWVVSFVGFGVAPVEVS